MAAMPSIVGWPTTGARLEGGSHQDEPRAGHVQAVQEAAAVLSVAEDGPLPKYFLGDGSGWPWALHEGLVCKEP